MQIIGCDRSGGSTLPVAGLLSTQLCSQMINHGTHFPQPPAIRATAAPWRGHMARRSARIVPQLRDQRPFTLKAGHDARMPPW